MGTEEIASHFAYRGVALSRPLKDKKVGRDVEQGAHASAGSVDCSCLRGTEHSIMDSGWGGVGAEHGKADMRWSKQVRCPSVRPQNPPYPAGPTEQSMIALDLKGPAARVYMSVNQFINQYLLYVSPLLSPVHRREWPDPTLMFRSD